jgi:hypothetical protein
MTKILEVAKSFEQHAKTQNAAIEKAVIKEFEKLRGVIEREGVSVCPCFASLRYAQFSTL